MNFINTKSFNKKRKVLLDQDGYTTTDIFNKVPEDQADDDLILLEDRLRTEQASTISAAFVSPVSIPRDKANYLTVTGTASTGSLVTVAAAGSDSNISMNLTPKGIGGVNIVGTTYFGKNKTNYLANAGNDGGNPLILLEGASTDISLDITPKGVGTVNVNGNGMVLASTGNISKSSGALTISTASGANNITLTPGTTGMLVYKKFVCCVSREAAQTLTNNATYAHATADIVKFDTAVSDPFSAFTYVSDTDSYITVPLTGSYRITTNLKLTDGNNEKVIVYVDKNNGTLVTPGIWFGAAVGAYGGAVISVVVQLTANDTVRIKVAQNNTKNIMQGTAIGGMNMTNQAGVQQGLTRLSVEYISS